MSDDAPDTLFGRLRDRVSDALAPDDGSASPQARDEDPISIGREEFREEIDARDVKTFVEEYYKNPLIRIPIQNFASDVTEPGVSVEVEGLGDDEDVPEVVYQGETTPLDDALEDWITSSYIDGYSFSGNGADLLEEVVKDRRGRRGTAIVELAYDDPRDRNELLGLKPMRPETTVTYTREGKAIPLRPGDQPGTFDTIAIDDLNDDSRNAPPETPAGKTAAIVQFDDVFGADERDEIPFALDDVAVSTHDADTGEIYGRPDTASVINRARSLRRKLRYVDQSVINTAFGNIIATVESQDEDVVKNVRDNLTPNVRDRDDRDLDPETVSATNAPVDITEIQGNVPQVEQIIQQEIEFVLTAMPTPLYRVGFAGDINRDVTSEQGEDYRDQVKRERRRLEGDFQGVLEQKARELILGGPKSDEDLPVTPRLRLRPSDAESPLRDEEFDAGEFSTLMSGLSTAAGPKGGATALVPAETIVDTFLDMNPDDVLSESSDSPPRAGMESEAAREVFERLQDDDDPDGDGEAALATRYASGDPVSTPDGDGVVVETAETTIEVDGERVEGSSRSPAYVVALDSGGASTFRASDLTKSDWFPDDDVDPSTLDQAARAAVDPLRFPAVHNDRDRDSDAERLEDPGVGFDSLPDGWDRSSVLKAWSSLGGSFTSARREFRGEVRDPAGLAAALKDEVLGFETWRGGFAASPATLAVEDPDGPFGDVPVLPDTLENFSTAWLIRYAEYVAADKPEIPEEDRLATIDQATLRRELAELEFNPTLHPRDPETGQFVERPFDLPDDAPDFTDLSTKETLEYIAENDDSGLLDDTLFNPDENITADQVPVRATSLDDVPDPDEFDGDVPTNPPIDEGDAPDVPDVGESVPLEDQGGQIRLNELDGLERGDLIAVDDTVAEFENASQNGRNFLYRDGSGDVQEGEVPRDTVRALDTAIDEKNPETGDDGGGDGVSLDEIPVNDESNFVDVEDERNLEEGDILRVERDGTPEMARVVDAPDDLGNEPTVENADGNQYQAAIGGTFAEGDITRRYAPDEVTPDVADARRGTDVTARDVDPDDSRFIEDLDQLDDDGANWEQSPFVAEEGDLIRYQPRGSDDWSFGVDPGGGMGGTTLVTPQGDKVDVGGMTLERYRPETEDIDADSFNTVSDDLPEVNLSTRDGPPSRRREGVDRGDTFGETLPGAAVDEQAIPEGAIIAEDKNDPESYQVLGYDEDFRGTQQIVIRSHHGNTRRFDADRFDRRGFKRYRRRADARVSIDGWDDADSIDARREAVRETLDTVLPRFDNLEDTVLDRNSVLPIADDQFDRVKESIARELARSKSRDHAETVVARMTAAGDDKDRASASPNANTREEPRGRFQIGDGRNGDEETITHELGHTVGYAYGFQGTSNDKDGAVYPMPEHSWESDRFEAEEKYGLAVPPRDRNPQGGTQDIPSDRNSFFTNGESIADDVETEIGSGLDGRNFSPAADDLGNPGGGNELLSEGQMIRLGDTPSHNEPKNWEVAEAQAVDPGLPRYDAPDDAVPRDELDDEFRTRMNTVQTVTLESRDGDQVRATLSARSSGPSLQWSDDAEYVGSEQVDMTRQSVPDDWRTEYPDADDVLGTDDFDDPEEAARNLAAMANKAWYRMSWATKQLGAQDAQKLSIVNGGYDAKNAHEVMSAIHELMRSKEGDLGPRDDPLETEIRDGIDSLVRHHPGLLEAYRNVYDLPEKHGRMANGILDRLGKDFRFDGYGDPSDDEAELLDDLYSEGSS